MRVLCVLPLLCLAGGCGYFKADADVAFLGDSITQSWYYPQNNFGVFGNSTAQILARSKTILAERRYSKVVVMGGTNDVLLKIDPAATIRNLETIGSDVQQLGEEPVLCEIPPIFHNYNHADLTDYSNQVRMLNQQIVALAARRHWKLVDYYDPMRDHPEYSSDGVHMKRRGYWVMEWTLLHAVPDL